MINPDEWYDTDEYSIEELLSLYNQKIKKEGSYFHRVWPALVRNPDSINPEFQQDIGFAMDGRVWRLTYWPSEIDKGRVRTNIKPHKGLDLL